MSEDPKANPPIVRGDTAIKDIGTVVDFILSRREGPLRTAGFDRASVGERGYRFLATSRRKHQVYAIS